MFMSGSDFDFKDELEEDTVWQWVIFDNANNNSLFNVIRLARENARGIRNKISTELWEAINRWYLYVRSLKERPFRSADIYTFSQDMTAHIAVIKSNISNTILHNDGWHFISLGIFIERALQVLRILRSKISDCTILSDNGVNKALMQYQWTTMLKSLEAFDVHTQYFKGKMTSGSIFEMILAIESFPRSILYTTNRIKRHLEGISVRSPRFEEDITPCLQSVETSLQFEKYEDEDAVVNQIDELYSHIADIHIQVEKLYFQ